MKAILGFLFLVFALTSSYSQSIQLMGELNVGTYKMESLKNTEHPNQILVQLPIKLVSDFPPFPGFRATVAGKIDENLHAGLQFGFNSTGRRFSYSDYTAQVNYDTKLRGASLGLYTKIKIVEIENWDVAANLSVIFIRNRLKAITQVVSSYTDQYDELVLQSNNIGVQPGISVGRKLGQVVARCNLYYEFNSPGDLLYAGNSTPIPGRNGPVKVEWDGFRMGLAVQYTLGGKEQ